MGIPETDDNADDNATTFSHISIVFIISILVMCFSETVGDAKCNGSHISKVIIFKIVRKSKLL